MHIPRGKLTPKAVAFALLTPAILGNGGECPFFGSGPARLTRSGTVAFSPGRLGNEEEISLEATIAPEHNVNARFVVTSPDALEPSDVAAAMILSCHLAPGESSFPVTFVSDGLTRLVGSFSRNAKDQCIDSGSGQRQAAFWSVFVRRNAAQTVSFQWEVDWVAYQAIGQ